MRPFARDDQTLLLDLRDAPRQQNSSIPDDRAHGREMRAC